MTNMQRNYYLLLTNTNYMIKRYLPYSLVVADFYLSILWIAMLIAIYPQIKFEQWAFLLIVSIWGFFVSSIPKIIDSISYYNFYHFMVIQGWHTEYNGINTDEDLLFHFYYVNVKKKLYIKLYKKQNEWCIINIKDGKSIGAFYYTIEEVKKSILFTTK